MTLRAVIRGLASALPAQCVLNSELPAALNTSDAWIRERTGITQRYIASEDESTASLAADAASKALDYAGMDAASLDLIIVSTSTPDRTMPSTACLVQAALGNHSAAAFDLNAACSGFVYGLTIANAMIGSGQARRVLVIGAEVMSRIVDWNDRRTCVLFGDGAGAVVLEAANEKERGILASYIQSDGSEAGLLQTSGGVGLTQTAGLLAMQGKEVFRHAVDKMGEGMMDLLHRTRLPVDAIDWVVPHQANQRIIQAIARKAAINENRFVLTLDRHANTSAASIPLALSDMQANGQLREGQILALPALGAGLTWGCCIIRW